MKVLLVLLLIVLLLTGCEVAKSEPDYDARISALEKSVEEIQKHLGDRSFENRFISLEDRLVEIERAIYGERYENLWTKTSLESRVKAIEDKLGIKPGYWPP